jgi:hypothetical protein
MKVSSQPLETYRSDAWREQRIPFVTASNAAVMFDRHPYTTPGEYWVEKMTRSTEEIEMTLQMERGHVLEAPIANWWSSHSKVEIHQSPRLHICGPLAATCDYLTSDGSPVEIKTTSNRTETPFQYWIDQLQAQIACLDAQEGYLVWFDGDVFQDLLVKRDDSFILDLHDRAEQFLSAVETEMRPDWITLGVDEVKDLHPAPVGFEVVDEEGVDLLYSFSDLKNDEKATKVDLAEAKDRIANLFGNAEELRFEGQTVATWKARKGNLGFDVAAFNAAHPEIDLDVFRTRGKPTRVLKIVVGL